MVRVQFYQSGLLSQVETLLELVDWGSTLVFIFPKIALDVVPRKLSQSSDFFLSLVFVNFCAVFGLKQIIFWLNRRIKH